MKSRFAGFVACAAVCAVAACSGDSPTAVEQAEGLYELRAFNGRPTPTSTDPANSQARTVTSGTLRLVASGREGGRYEVDVRHTCPDGSCSPALPTILMSGVYRVTGEQIDFGASTIPSPSGNMPPTTGTLRGDTVSHTLASNTYRYIRIR
jgi:hypothetical protein